MGDHLLDHVRPWLEKTPSERIAFMRSPRWIAYSAARAALARLEDLLVRPASLRTQGLLLAGPYANGKSMIAERFAITHLRRCQAEDRPQQVFVVQTREGTGLLNFYDGILTALGAPQTRVRHTAAKAEQLDHLFRQLRPRVLIFDEFHNCLRGRTRDVEGIFAVLRRFGREYDISPVLVGEVAVYDYMHLTDEMASRFTLAPVPRWTDNEEYLALLDSLEAALPLMRPSNLSDERTARAVFALSEGLIGEVVGLVTRAATAAIRDGSERITAASIEALGTIPLSRRRGSPQREALL